MVEQFKDTSLISLTNCFNSEEKCKIIVTKSPPGMGRDGFLIK